MEYKRTRHPRSKDKHAWRNTRSKELLASQLLPSDCPYTLWQNLTPQEMAFCAEYIIDFNGARAAREAGGCSTVASQAVQAHYWLRQDKVKQLIRWLLKKRERRLEISADRTVRELMNIAFADPYDVCSWDENTLDLRPAEQVDVRARACIKELSRTRNGVTVRLHDKLKALELLGRHQGLFNDKLTLSGDPDNPLLDIGKTLDFLKQLANTEE